MSGRCEEVKYILHNSVNKGEKENLHFIFSQPVEEISIKSSHGFKKKKKKKNVQSHHHAAIHARFHADNW